MRESNVNAGKPGFLDRLDEGVLLGDGGMGWLLERRGYVQAGPWTPEAVIEFPEAVVQAHKEFVRCGADVHQAFTSYASEDQLNNRGNEAGELYGVKQINEAACKLVCEAVEFDHHALVAASISRTPTYLASGDKEAVKNEFKKQLMVFKEQHLDVIICEPFEHVEECVWAVEAVKEIMPDIPICAGLSISEDKDVNGVPTGECGVRLVKAGADVVGISFEFDPFRAIRGVKKMMEALNKADLKVERQVHFMTQPVGFWTPDATLQGVSGLPEYPYALEPRMLSRIDAAKYAREAFESGIRYIGGSSGFEPYHIRAMAEELAEDRFELLPEASEKHKPNGGFMDRSAKPWHRVRANQEWWEDLIPATGRPSSHAVSKPADWGITRGESLMAQQTQPTHKSTLEKLKKVHSVMMITQYDNGQKGELKFEVF